MRGSVGDLEAKALLNISSANIEGKKEEKGTEDFNKRDDSVWGLTDVYKGVKGQHLVKSLWASGDTMFSHFENALEHELHPKSMSMLLGSASFGAVYDFPISTPADPLAVTREQLVTKVVNDTRRLQMKADFLFVKAALDENNAVNKLFQCAAGGDEDKSGKLMKKLFMLAQKLETDIYDEFDLKVELLALHKAGLVFFPGNAPSSKVQEPPKDLKYNHFLQMWQSQSKEHCKLLADAAKANVKPGKYSAGFCKVLDGIFRHTEIQFRTTLKVAVPKPYDRFSAEKFLTMTKAEGKSVKSLLEGMDTVAEAMFNQAAIEDIKVGSFIECGRIAFTINCLIHVIGWMLLCDTSDIIHADPHPGNVMHHIDGAFPQNEENDDGESLTTEYSYDEVMEGKVDTLDVSVRVAIVEKFRVNTNVLTLIDWGAYIDDETIKKDAGPVETLGELREALRQVVTNLSKGEDRKAEVVKGLQKVGMKDGWFDVVKAIMLGCEENVKGKIVNFKEHQDTVERGNAATSPENVDHMIDGLSATMAKVANVLVYAGALVREQNAVLQKYHPDAKIKNLCEHWEIYTTVDPGRS